VTGHSDLMLAVRTVMLTRGGDARLSDQTQARLGDWTRRQKATSLTSRAQRGGQCGPDARAR
jgi:hypothetical protein